MSNPAFNLPNHERHILPANTTDLELAVDLAGEDNLAQIPLNKIWQTWSADECPEHILPWLAWAMSIEEWDSAWEINIKREVLRQTVAVHRLRGTPASIKKDLATLAITAVYSEWREYNGCPHTIKIGLFPEPGRTTPITDKDVEIVRQKIYRDKAQRDSLDIEQNANAYSGAICASVGFGSTDGEIIINFIGDRLITGARCANHAHGGHFADINITFN